MKKVLLFCCLVLLGISRAFAQDINLELPSTGVVGEPVQATVRFLPPPSSITDSFQFPNYSIDWGDDSSQVLTPPPATAGNEKTVTHTYQSPGTFTVSFCVSYSEIFRCSKKVIVVRYKNPRFEAPASSAPFAKTTIELRDLYATLEYKLEWGDGSTENISQKTSASLMHEYSKPGTYTIRLTAPQVSSLTQPHCAKLERRGIDSGALPQPRVQPRLGRWHQRKHHGLNHSDAQTHVHHRQNTAIHD
jgi:hypothetical protein